MNSYFICRFCWSSYQKSCETEHYSKCIGQEKQAELQWRISQGVTLAFQEEVNIVLRNFDLNKL